MFNLMSNFSGSYHFRFFLHTKKNRQLFGRIKRIAYLCSVNKTICVKLKHFNYGKLKTAKS